MAIRYDNKLNNEIRRIVNNYNSKIRRLDTTDSNIYVPKKYDASMIKALKESVSNRADLRRKLGVLEEFTKRGGEALVGSNKVPKYQLVSAKKYQSLLKRRINKKLDFYRSTEATNKGIKEDYTMAKMRETDYVNALAKKVKLLDVNIESLTSDILDSFLGLLESNARTRSDKVWQQNFIDLFEDTASTYGYDKEKLKEMMKKIKNLKPSEFNRLFNTERTVQQVIYYYKQLKDIGNEVNIKAMQDDVFTNLDSLYDNLDTILQDYE